MGNVVVKYRVWASPLPQVIQHLMKGQLPWDCGLDSVAMSRLASSPVAAVAVVATVVILGCSAVLPSGRSWARPGRANASTTSATAQDRRSRRELSWTTNPEVL